MQSNSQKTFPQFDLGDVILREKKESDAEDFFNHYLDYLLRDSHKWITRP